MYYKIYDGDNVVSEGSDRDLVIEAAITLCPDSENLIGVRTDDKGREASFFVKTNGNLTTAMWG